MGGWRGSRLGGLALFTVTGLAVLSGCQGVAFRMDRPGRSAAVLGLGEATPFIQGVTPGPAEGTPAPPAEPPIDVYAATRAGMLNPAVRPLPPRLYVADARRGEVAVIDPRTYRVVQRVGLGRAAQGIVPSWDLKTLWIRTHGGFVPLDPATGRPGPAVQAGDPRDLLFTPDGRLALVPAGGLERVDIRDAHTLRLRGSIPVPCRDPGHTDFSADGSFAVLTCPGTGQLVRLDPGNRHRPGILQLAPGARPQDIRLSPDGSRFYVADSASGGVWLIDAAGFRSAGFVPTGKGASALSLSRNDDALYVSGQSGLAVIALPGNRVTATWPLPQGDIGGVSEDGSVLWLADHSGGTVCAISTVDGRPLHKIRSAPRALVLFPQPGRYSLGPTLR